MAKNQKRKAKANAAKRSEIIEQCVIYAQSIAAYQAGFEATDDFDYAGCDKGQGGRRPFRQADRALLRLIALSAVNAGDRLPTLEELAARTRVLSVIRKHTGDFTHPETIESSYICLFAGELEDYFKKSIEAAWVESNKANVPTPHQANA
jgi:hypothetical protein